MTDVWITAMLAMKMYTYTPIRLTSTTTTTITTTTSDRIRNMKMIRFLNHWYNQTLLYSTQDQVYIKCVMYI